MLLRKYHNWDVGANWKSCKLLQSWYVQDWEGSLLLKEADGLKESKLFVYLRTSSGKFIQYLHIRKEKSGNDH